MAERCAVCFSTPPRRRRWHFTRSCLNGVGVATFKRIVMCSISSLRSDVVDELFPQRPLQLRLLLYVCNILSMYWCKTEVQTGKRYHMIPCTKPLHTLLLPSQALHSPRYKYCEHVLFAPITHSMQQTWLVTNFRAWYRYLTIVCNKLGRSAFRDSTCIEWYFTTALVFYETLSRLGVEYIWSRDRYLPPCLCQWPQLNAVCRHYLPTDASLTLVNASICWWTRP